MALSPPVHPTRLSQKYSVLHYVLRLIYQQIAVDLWISNRLDVSAGPPYFNIAYSGNGSQASHDSPVIRRQITPRGAHIENLLLARRAGYGDSCANPVTVGFRTPQ